MVLRRGDPDSGGVLCVMRGKGGVCVLSQARIGDGELAWMRSTGADPVDEPIADAYVTRQVARDPDLWVIEFDSPDFAAPFDGKVI